MVMENACADHRGIDMVDTIEKARANLADLRDMMTRLVPSPSARLDALSHHATHMREKSCCGRSGFARYLMAAALRGA